MNQLNLFIELTRLKKPIGFMLLFWPCAWGLTLAYDFSTSLNNYFFYLILFFLGSVFMRSAGVPITPPINPEIAPAEYFLIIESFLPPSYFKAFLIGSYIPRLENWYMNYLSNPAWIPLYNPYRPTPSSLAIT